MEVSKLTLKKLKEARIKAMSGMKSAQNNVINAETICKAATLAFKILDTEFTKRITNGKSKTI